VGIGEMTGFGEIRPLPGIWNSLHLDTAVTLPVGVEAYAAFALHAWLTSNPAVSNRTHRFARWSAIAAMILGMSGSAPSPPVIIAPSTSHTEPKGSFPGPAHDSLSRDPDHLHRAQDRLPARARIEDTKAAVAKLIVAGRPISRRSLRSAGLHGSNADLGMLARMARSNRAQYARPNASAMRC
jgi:hypothetical protein